MPIVDPRYWPPPKSACIPVAPPMKLMIAVELGSTAADEMPSFQRLSGGNGTKPPRLAPWPSDMVLQLEACGEPVTWRWTAPDALLPGFGLLTVTAYSPAEGAVPVAMSWVDEAKVVCSE